MPADYKSQINQVFPLTSGTSADKTSDETPDYNCIAYMPLVRMTAGGVQVRATIGRLGPRLT